jgi:alanyl-tRNA synthetase
MSVASALKITNPKMMLEAAMKAEATIRAQQKEIDELNAKLAAARMDEYMKNATDVGGIKVVTAHLRDAGADALRTMCEKAKSAVPDSVTVIASINDGKVTFAAGCGKQAMALGANAGKIVKAVAQAAGGNGGGKPDLAMAGAKDADKVTDALAVALDVVKELLQ